MNCLKKPCPNPQIGLTPKLTITPYRGGAWELLILNEGDIKFQYFKITPSGHHQLSRVSLLFRHGRQRGFKLSDPAQSRGEELFKGGNLIHS